MNTNLLDTRPVPAVAGPLVHNYIKDKRTYKTGDGETPTYQRPGSERAYTLPSKGI